MKLVDAPRCPYCARVRLTLAEKGVEYEKVVVDLSNRPEWLYYAYRRGDPNRLDEKLESLPVGGSLFVDLAYLPWVLRGRELYGASLPERLETWLEGLLERPAVAAELGLVHSLA